MAKPKATGGGIGAGRRVKVKVRRPGRHGKNRGYKTAITGKHHR